MATFPSAEGRRERAAPTAPPTRTIDRLTFRSDEEVAVYRALVAAGAALAEFAGIGIAANARLALGRGRSVTVDLLVTHRGRAAVIEVDGPFHGGRWVADRSRDRLLEDAGVAFVDRLAVEDLARPGELDLFVRRFLYRLAAA